MAERILLLNVGRSSNPDVPVPADLKGSVEDIVKAFQEQQLIGEDDKLSVVLKVDRKLRAGSIGAEAQVEQVFREGEDGTIIDTVVQKYRIGL